MGKNNRARRAAKTRARRSENHAPRPGAPTPGGGFQFSARELAAGWFDLAARSLRTGDAETSSIFTEKLATLPTDAADAEIEGTLQRVLVALWEHGWQPAELLRQVRRKATPLAARLATIAAIADHAPRQPETMHPDWASQISTIRGAFDAAATITPFGWFAGWCRADAIERTEALQAAVRMLAAFYDLGPIAEVIPPPGRGRRQSARTAKDDPVLAKVRALLAQAESTTFPAEAETFTAKAQELMARHAIDRALLSEQLPGTRPGTRRIAIDEPYLDVKSYLLQVVAEHSRCRSIFHSDYAFSSIVGFEGDLDSCEMLFTSLLVQAQVALSGEARNSPAGARTRSRSFRSSFLLAYTHRIGDRLAEINRGVLTTVEAETKRSTLPVLAARRQEVDDVVDAQFGELHSSSVRSGWDGLGGMRGRLAADQAHLNFGYLQDTPTTP